MSDDRLARALLRLYPPAWRARYGDEFLALVADTGLSWRTLADVSSAALVERARAIAGAKLWEGDPVVAGQPLPPRTVGEALTVTATFFGLVGLSALVLGLLGVPYPGSRLSWFQKVFWLLYIANANVWITFVGSPAAHGAARFASFGAAAALAGGALLIGNRLAWLGIPEPSEGALLAVFFGICLLGGGRFMYFMIRPLVSYPARWPVMHSRERLAWCVAVLMLLSLFGLADQAGEAFWSLAFLFWMFRHGSLAVTAVGVARRRSEREAIFGAPPGGPRPPAAV
jgi:hypothetical protein